MIDADITVIRFSPSDLPLLPEIIGDEPPSVPSASVPQSSPLQTPEPKDWRPLGAEW